MSVTTNIPYDDAELKKVIDVFYARMIADDRIRDFFTIVDMNAIKRKQLNLFRILLSANIDSTTQKYMLNAHKPLVDKYGLNNTHFDIMANILSESLRVQKVPGKISERIMKNFESLRSFVLGNE